MRQAERIEQVAAAKVLQRHADLPPGGRIENVDRRVGLVFLGLGRGVGLGRNQRGQAVKVLRRQAKLDRLVAQEGPVGRCEPPLGRPQADQPLELIELLVALDPPRRGELGIVRRAHHRVAQQRPA